MPKDKTNKANLGKSFEDLILLACSQYQGQGKAIIDKVHTPWVVIRAGKQIVSAYPKEKSTVDFMGQVAGGRGISFEAKSTENKTSFPLKQIDQHQIEFLEAWQAMGGISFFLIEFARHEKIYLLAVEHVKMWYDKFLAGWGRSSITYDWIQEYGREVEQENYIILDFLAAWEAMQA